MESQILPPSVQSRSKKLAIFDFDGTLVQPKEGRRFPKDKNDWEWLRPSVPKKLKQYAKEKYRLVIVTDQSKPWKVEMIQDVIQTLKLSITVIIGVKEDQKPNTRLFLSYFTPDKKIDIENSFYVGDAAGRSGDWADRDIQFAKNMNLKFYVPEEIFDATPIRAFPKIKMPNQKEIIIMIGYPGSGKSTLVKEQLVSSGYYRVDGDVFKTAKAMIKEAKNYPDKSIVFDATNGTHERRQEYINYAKEIGVPIRCVWVNTPIEKALERVKKREQEIGVHVPAIALYLYRKKFEEPTSDECEVVKIDQL